MTMSGSTSSEQSMAELKQSRDRSRLLETHRSAMFILTQKDRPIPSLQEMKEDLEKDELTSVKERITTAKANHKANLERIYAIHAEDYLDDQRLRRESREDSHLGGEGMSSRLAEWSEKRDVRIPFVDTSLSLTTKEYDYSEQPLASINHHYEAALMHSVATECTRYSTVIQNLSQQKFNIDFQLEEEKRQRDAAFPMTLEEFHLKPRDIQIRVANFLSSDDVKRERMMSEFGWAWRQVTPLIREFGTNSLEIRDESINEDI
ncbi:hypothetical protein NP233_g873 [Leucocoprinus birnbaumii]|uniref:Uncharacterized protein n=1 Tax=Leucocoprinus birnbaumii TaxID=56174 RepID=A0AAD5W4Y2_9AGAR|nr:hypothetical protein NP233_g873 [Leucocoprinus birnbaumii]